MLAGSATQRHAERRLARMGDPVWCPTCGTVGYIAQGNPTFINEFVAVATDRQRVQCVCPDDNHRLLAVQQDVQADMEASIDIPAEFADYAQKSADKITLAIKAGTYRSAFDLARHGKP